MLIIKNTHIRAHQANVFMQLPNSDSLFDHTYKVIGNEYYFSLKKFK